MAGEGIKTVFHYVPLHSAPAGRPFDPDLVLPVTDQVSSGLVRLPVYPDLSSDDVGRVIASTRAFDHD